MRGTRAGSGARGLVAIFGIIVWTERTCFGSRWSGGYPDEVRADFGALVSLLRRVFGPWETVTSLYADFYSRMQSVCESLAEFSRALIRLHQRIEGAAPTVAERQALAGLADGALKHQLVVGVRAEWVRDELPRLVLRLAGKPFIVVREEALRLLCEEEASVIEMRQVEKAASGLSGPVGSVSCVLSLDAAVVGDGGVIADSGDVGRYVSVGDERRDMELSGVVVSGAVSGGMCDLYSVSPDVMVVRVGDMSLTGGGETVVSDLDEPMRGDSSVVTADEFDGCACDSLVSDGAGDSSAVEVVDDVVACSDDTLFHDVARVGGWLSVLGDTLMGGAGVARCDRRDAGVVVGPGVTQPGWVDGLVCADDSLRPEPPPMHAMCLCRSSLAAA